MSYRRSPWQDILLFLTEQRLPLRTLDTDATDGPEAARVHALRLLASPDSLTPSQREQIAAYVELFQ